MGNLESLGYGRVPGERVSDYNHGFSDGDKHGFEAGKAYQKTLQDYSLSIEGFTANDVEVLSDLMSYGATATAAIALIRKIKNGE